MAKAMESDNANRWRLVPGVFTFGPICMSGHGRFYVYDHDLLRVSQD